MLWSSNESQSVVSKTKAVGQARPGEKVQIDVKNLGPF